MQIQTLLAHSPVVAVPMAGVASTAGPPVARTLGVHLVARHPSSLPNHSRAQKLSFFQASLRSSCGRHPAWATGWCPLGCSSAHSAAHSSKRTAAVHSSAKQQRTARVTHTPQPPPALLLLLLFCKQCYDLTHVLSCMQFDACFLMLVPEFGSGFVMVFWIPLHL